MNKNAISMQEFENIYQNEKGVKILDVREVDEYAAGHVPEADNLPLSELGSKPLNLNKDDHYYVICAAGGRAQRASSYLNQQGYNTTYLTSGMNYWKGPKA